MNKAVVTGEGSVCGFFCSSTAVGTAPALVENSINHGEVTGKTAYGIGGYILDATNIINFGKVTGTQKSYSLWEAARYDTVFCLDTTYNNCVGASKITKAADGKYYVTGTKMLASEMLNWNIAFDEKWQTLSYWESNLELQKKEGKLSLAHSLVIGFTPLFLIGFMMVQSLFSF